MKQKSSDNDVVTKVFLKKELKREFNSFEKRLDNKMDKRFELQGKVFRLELKLALQETVEQAREMFRGFRNEIFTHIDPLTKNMEVSRQDRIIASDQTARIRKRVDNHEKRIKKLESVQVN